MKPTDYSFPQRNRIIAGLADVLFLPEAGEKSGSLITVNFALEMHKPVYGVPNSIFSEQSVGINQFIAQGQIKAVTNFSDFFDHFFHKLHDGQGGKTEIMREDISDTEKKILDIISEKNICGLQDIYAQGDISSQDIITSLTFLEIKKYIYQETPGIYRVSRR